jgi:predicted enzyme related to lactoylglutathione lyase
MEPAPTRMTSPPATVVHLELHSGGRDRAAAFYDQLLHWRTELIEVRSGTYHALGLGGALDGGIVECGLSCARWLPYVEVAEIRSATALGERLGATVVVEPREGPAGWRSVLACRAAGEIALWQPKRAAGAAR